MNIRFTTLATALLFGATAGATDLHLNVRSPSGLNTVTVAPGATVPYEIVGELSDSLNEGLAFFAIDLEFDGGVLSPAQEPTAGPMVAFDEPNGVTNPTGFGGFPKNGKLLQIGGAQNTWNNVFAPVPKGAVTTGLAKPTTPEVLVHGNLTAPLKVGTYKLRVSDMVANVISQGEIGVPVWRVEPAGKGQTADLTIKVSALSGNVNTVSISAVGSQVLSLNAGVPNGGRPYLMLGSFSGTTPGLPVPPHSTLPLNFDGYMQFLLVHPNNVVLSNSMGVLSASGTATATFKLPPNVPASFVGTTVNHAYLLFTPPFVSDAVAVTLVP